MKRYCCKSTMRSCHLRFPDVKVANETNEAKEAKGQGLTGKPKARRGTLRNPSSGVDDESGPSAIHWTGVSASGHSKP